MDRGAVRLFMLAGPLDIAFGADERSMDPLKTPENCLFWYNLPVWFWAFLWLPTLVFGLWQILVAGQMSIWESVLMAVVLAGEAQAVFIVGHELIHRRSLRERRLASSCSPPPRIRNMSPSTSTSTMPSLAHRWTWALRPRARVSGGISARSGKQLYRLMARRRLPVWHYSNPLWRCGIETAFWYALVYWMGGPWAIPVFAILCLGVVFSIKISNYIQHYGLRRVRLPSGRFEKIRGLSQQQVTLLM